MQTVTYGSIFENNGLVWSLSVARVLFLLGVEVIVAVVTVVVVWCAKAPWPFNLVPWVSVPYCASFKWNEGLGAMSHSVHNSLNAPQRPQQSRHLDIHNWFPPLSCRECHIDNHVTERTDLPDHLIVGSQGTDIFTQELMRVNIDHDSSQRYFDTFNSKLS